MSDQLSALALLDEPVRRRLYDWVVGERRPVGRDEAAHAAGVGRALATFHLERLTEAGLLVGDYQRLNERRGPGAGRPARVYTRAPGEIAVSLPDRRYVVAAEVLASALEGEQPASGIEAARAAGHALGRRLAAGGSRRGSQTTRLRRVLADAGYEPTEPDAHGTIRLRNCPYDALVDAHRPLICSTNLAMAEGMVEGIGIKGVTPVLTAEPGWCCVSFHDRSPT